MSTMDEVLNNEDVEEIIVEPSGETVTAEATETEPKGEKTEEVVEETTEEASPAPDTETKVPLSAIHGERDRRQKAESQRDDLQKQLDQVQKTPPTSVFTDEGKFVEEMNAQTEATLTNFALNQSEFFAAREIGRAELDVKIELFKDLAESNPQLKARFGNAVSPYHELIEIVDQHDELEKMKDLSGYKARLKAEAKAEVEAEVKADLAKKKDVIDSIPESLAGDGSEGGLTSQDWSGPPSAEETFDPN